MHHSSWGSRGILRAPRTTLLTAMHAMGVSGGRDTGGIIEVKVCVCVHLKCFRFALVTNQLPEVMLGSGHVALGHRRVYRHIRKAPDNLRDVVVTRGWALDIH